MLIREINVDINMFTVFRCRHQLQLDNNNISINDPAFYGYDLVPQQHFQRPNIEENIETYCNQGSLGNRVGFEYCRSSTPEGRKLRMVIGLSIAVVSEGREFEDGNGLEIGARYLKLLNKYLSLSCLIRNISSK